MKPQPQASQAQDLEALRAHQKALPKRSTQVPSMQVLALSWVVLPTLSRPSPPSVLVVVVVVVVAREEQEQEQ